MVISDRRMVGDDGKSMASGSMTAWGGTCLAMYRRLLRNIHHAKNTCFV